MRVIRYIKDLQRSDEALLTRLKLLMSYYRFVSVSLFKRHKVFLSSAYFFLEKIANIIYV